MAYLMLLLYPVLSASSVSMAKAGLTRVRRGGVLGGVLILGLGAVLFVVGLSIFGFALFEVPVSKAVLISQPLNVALTVMFGAVFFKERLNRRRLAGMALILAGMVLVLWKV